MKKLLLIISTIALLSSACNNNVQTSSSTSLDQSGSLTVVSPKNGDSFTQGANNLITWQGVDINLADIWLTDTENKKLGYISSKLSNNNSSPATEKNSLYWTGQMISSNPQVEGGADIQVSPGKYRIMIAGPDNREASSDVFTIVSPNLSANQSSSNNFQSYNNPALGITLDYPQNWTVDVQKNIAGPVIGFSPPQPKFGMNYLTISFDTRSFKSIVDIQAVYAQVEKAPNVSYKYSMEEMNIGGQKAYAFIRSDLPDSREIYLFRNNHIYSITTGVYGQEAVAAMIVSIKFI